ncbi:H/ACA RNA-protein complex protein Gar1 [Candidatus Thorarchaeota archaeon]|nr:MAG: H/ACA RNA-protein complex protein Gar1 [Candidatus Thorarchaeota archaeon]
MRRLGKVLHISKRGSIIVRTNQTPPMKANVVNKRSENIGIVKDVFGPVNEPYVTVQPRKNMENPEGLVGQMLYLYKKRNHRRNQSM